jgi:hypothetical protein
MHVLADHLSDLTAAGLYLFVLPYATRWRRGRRTD